MTDKDVATLSREMAQLIRRFVSGEAGPYEWDDFMGVKFDDPRLEQIRLQATAIVDTSLVDRPDESATVLLRLAAALDHQINP